MFETSRVWTSTKKRLLCARGAVGDSRLRDCLYNKAAVEDCSTYRIIKPTITRRARNRTTYYMTSPSVASQLDFLSAAFLKFKATWPKSRLLLFPQIVYSKRFAEAFFRLPPSLALEEGILKRKPPSLALEEGKTRGRALYNMIQIRVKTHFLRGFFVL